MKNRLFWRYVDIVGQVLMLAPLVFFGVTGNHNMFLLTYFTLGGWQALSCLIIRVSEGKPGDSSRGNYSRLLVWVSGLFAGCGGLALLFNVFADHDGQGVCNALSTVFVMPALLEAIVMLVLGPVMAVWYGMITMEDIMELRGNIKLRHELQWRQV